MEERKIDNRVSYHDAKKVILQCELHGKDSQECIEGKKRLNIKDE